MNQLLQQIATAAQQLQQEGKEPSLALIKSRLALPTMSPALLQAYQAWRNGATVPVTAGTVEPAEPASSASQLQQQLDRIEAKLDLLLSRLAP